MGIGKGTKIHKWCNVYDSAEIGENCIVGSLSEIGDKVVIGDNSKIEAMVFIPKGVKIGKNVFVGPKVCFTNDMFPKATNGSWKVYETIVKNGASIGAGSVIRCGVTIGEDAGVGAGSVVLKDIPAGEVWAGNPARRIESAWK